MASDKEFAELVKTLAPQCNSINHVCSCLNLRGVEGYYKKIQKIIIDNDIDVSHFGTLTRVNKRHRLPSSDESYFAENTNINGTSLIKRLIKNGYKEYKCEECGLNEWNGKPIRLQIHHINGNHYDNRIENLQILCPNCHSQTDNYARKNKVKDNQGNIIINEKELLKMRKIVKVCPICGKKFKPTSRKQRFCSAECAYVSKRKPISENDIENAVKKAKSWLGASKLLNVSDKGLVKIAKRLGIYEKMKEMLKK